MEKLIRSLKDDYKVGVESAATTPVVYLYPDKLDRWSVERVSKLKEDQPLTRQDIMAKKILSNQIREQLDEQSPGLSSKFSDVQIEGMYNKSLYAGPYADQISKQHGVTIINMPRDNQVDKENVLYTFGITQKPSAKNEPIEEDPNDPYDHDTINEMPYSYFDAKQIKPLPGTSTSWRELIGKHEGEHVNQDLTKIGYEGVTRKILDFETRSDRVAIAHMHATGQHDVAQALVDIRALTAVSGDITHATGPQAHMEHYDGTTDKHVEAASDVKRQMLMGVSAESGLSMKEAESLRIKDPQKFVQILDEGMKNGRIPLPEEVGREAKHNLILAEMGITSDQYRKLEGDQIQDIVKAHDKLKQEGAFISKDPPNPHVKEYMEHYSAAVKRLFVEDTTPTTTEAKAEPAPVAKKSTAEIIAQLSDKEMKSDAIDQAQEAIERAVAKRLGITPSEAKNMRYATTDEQEKFLKTAEEELAAGNVKTTLPRTKSETEALMQKTMNLSDRAYEDTKYGDKFKFNAIQQKLANTGALSVEYSNPHLAKEVESELNIQRERIRDQKAADALALEEAKEAETAPDSADKKEEPEAEPEPMEVSHAAPKPGTYDYLRAKEQNTGNGTPKVDLNGDDGAKMRMGSLMPREYFALQADPVLAREQMAAKQAMAQQPELDQKPTPATRQPDALRI